MTMPSLVSEPESKSRLRLWIKLLRLTRTTEASIRENFRTEFSTTLPRFDVLAALYQRQHGISMSELSTMLLVSNGSATVVVDRLVKEGLVKREPVPGDKRALSVKLTKKGMKQFLSQAEEHEKWIDDMLSGISVKQVSQIVKILDSKKL